MNTIKNVKLDKSKEKIATMFDDIAPAYDKLNHFFTLNIDMHWRKEIVKYISDKKFPVNHILDLATGTGDLSKELLDLNPDVLFAADISGKMLEIQSKKISDTRLNLVQAEAKSMPFENDYFDIVTIGFGVRNFENLEESLKEIRRVMKNNGKLIILEMFKASGMKTELFNLYFGKIMPFIGNKVSKSNAYSYLFKSVNSFYNTDNFTGICKDCGFNLIHSKNNFLGIVNTIYLNKI